MPGSRSRQSCRTEEGEVVNNLNIGDHVTVKPGRLLTALGVWRVVDAPNQGRTLIRREGVIDVWAVLPAHQLERIELPGLI